MKIITLGLVIIFSTYNIIGSSTLDLVAKESKSQILPLTDHTIAEAASLASTQNKHALEIEARGSDFTCENGKSIDGRFKCDGKPDCSDDSDESLITCKSFLLLGNYEKNAAV